MTSAEPPIDDLPDPQDPSFMRALNALRSQADAAKAEEAEALQEWSHEQTDEEILDEFGLNMDVLREDP